MSEDTDKVLKNAAAMPESYEADGEKIVNRPLPDVIELDRHESRKKSGKHPFAALKMVKLITQGADR